MKASPDTWELQGEDELQTVETLLDSAKLHKYYSRIPQGPSVPALHLICFSNQNCPTKSVSRQNQANLDFAILQATPPENSVTFLEKSLKMWHQDTKFIADVLCPNSVAADL